MKKSRAAVGLPKLPPGWVLLGLLKIPPPAVAAAAAAAQVGSANATYPKAYAAHTSACTANACVAYTAYIACTEPVLPYTSDPALCFSLFSALHS